MDKCSKEELKVRLNRIEGQIRGINKMVEEDKICEGILTQLSAVESAIRSASREFMKNHLNHCVTESIERGEKDKLNEFNKILDKYLR